MNIFDQKEHCCGCTLCVSICPKNAILMETDREGFSYPVIDKQLCIECGLCRKVCSFRPVESKEEPLVFAVKHKDEGVREKSSSGGAFSALSHAILERNGVIYGAAFDENFNVLHRRATSKLECDRFRGSKYVQSGCGGIYSQVKRDLDEEKYVLFSGTPCQVAALNAYLKSSYERLYTVDLACHGAPSPLVWNEYKKHLSEKYHNKIKSVNFRNKDRGWRKKSIEIEFLDGGRYICDADNDPYYILFLRNYISRPSCHYCPFTNFNRPSDITVADFWGIENFHPELDDDKGVSLVLLNSKKGEIIFNEISGDLLYKLSNTGECLQRIFRAPTIPAAGREKFWNDFLQNGIKHALMLFGKPSFFYGIMVRFLIPFFRKIGVYKFALHTYNRLMQRKGAFKL